MYRCTYAPMCVCVYAWGVHEPYLRGCVSRGSLPGGVDTQLPARFFAFSRRKERCARIDIPLQLSSSRSEVASRVPTLEERSASPRALFLSRFIRRDRSRIGSATKGIARWSSTPRLPREVYVCLRVHGKKIRSDTGEDLSKFSSCHSGCPWRYNGCFRRWSLDRRPIRDFERRKRCVGGLLEDTERETWKASPSTSSRWERVFPGECIRRSP